MQVAENKKTAFFPTFLLDIPHLRCNFYTIFRIKFAKYEILAKCTFFANICLLRVN